MNNVLIAVDNSESSFWLVYYAMGLTHRISANVSILMILDDEYTGQTSDSDEWIGVPEKRLESLLAEFHSDTSHINYFVAQGNIEQELPKFIKENDITTLFIGQPQGKNKKQYAKFMKMVEGVNKKTDCHIEVAHKVSGYTTR